MHPRDAKQAALLALDEADRIAEFLSRYLDQKTHQDTLRKIRAQINLAIARLKDV